MWDEKKGNKNEEKEVKEMKVRIILYLHDEECKAGNRESWECLGGKFLERIFGCFSCKISIVYI